VRKSAKKICTAYDERWFLRKTENNPELGATKLAAEIENRVHKKVNSETVRRVLRRNNFHGRGSKHSFISQKNRNVRMEFAENHLQKGSEFWKKVLFADDNKYDVFG